MSTVQSATQPKLAHTPLLTDKRAVIFGASGAVGAAVATEFAQQGATVYLSSRRLAAIEHLAADLRNSGGKADAAQVDALHEPEVTAYIDRLADEAGGIDILLNVMGPPPREFGNGTPVLQLPVEQFQVPLATLVASQFITARAAALRMVQQHSGVILFITALPSRGMANVSAIGSAFGAVESFARCLATELGPAGVRVVGIRSGAMVDTATIQDSLEAVARRLSLPKEQVIANLAQSTLLKRLPIAADTARLAAFLASDGARAITGAIVNASSGAFMD